MVQFNEREMYSLNPSARLRNDGKYVIAAFPDPVATPLYRLAPIEAIIVSLCNGERTCEELIDIVSVMAEEKDIDPGKSASNAIEYVISNHLKPMESMTEPLIVPASTISREEALKAKKYDPVDFIVRKEQYQPMDMKLSFPASMLWLLTSECQVHCQYCYMDKTPIPREEYLDWGRTEELIREAKEKGTMAIYVSGGDPMVYPRLFDFFDLLDELDFSPLAIVTKCFISPENARKIAERKIIDHVQLSIDSSVPEIADFLVQSPGFYERMVESYKNLRETGVKKVTTKCVITPYNLPTIPKYYRDMKALGMDDILLATYCRSGYNHKDKLFNHPDDYEWLDEQIDRLKEEFPGSNIFYQNGPPQPRLKTKKQLEEEWENRARCTGARESITVAPNGRVTACEQMPFREEDYLGNLHTQSIEEVWNGKALDEYMIHPPMEKLAGTACYGCDEYDSCQTIMGVCVRFCCIHFGTRWAPPPNCPKSDLTPLRDM